MKNIFKTAFFWILSLLIVCPTLAYADWHGHGGGHEGGHRGGHTSFGFDLSLYPNTYYYNPVYYPVFDSLVLVSPPNYQPVEINGSIYYFYEGNYYISTNYGYQLVSPPVVRAPAPVIQAAPVVPVAPVPIVATTITTDTDDSFTLNIPNDTGGYTAVVIKRSGKGFVGPQGEFYPEFPKVSQLKVMYGK